MIEGSRPGSASDRLLGATPVASQSAGDLLRSVFAERGLDVPKDLVGEIGTDATTRWKLNSAQMLVVSNISREAAIDDAFECGRIAATAALSAVHATGAQPLFARLICACPSGASDLARKDLVAGVAVAIGAAGAVLADAQWIEAPALRFDVLVAGTVRPDRVKGTNGAQPGDALILAGALGTGIYAAAHAKHRLAGDDRAALIAEATQAHAAGIALGPLRNVHAIAAVGPAGLIGAALAMADAASLSAALVASRVPALPRALALAKSGVVAPQSSRNWNRDGARVDLAETVMPEMRALLTDPQTSGALLIACKPQSVERVVRLCEEGGDAAAAIGVFGSVDDRTTYRLSIGGPLGGVGG